MNYFLDTNICIYYLKGMHASIAENLLRRHPGEIRIPSMVKAELLYGAYRSNRSSQNAELVEEFLFPFQVVGFSDKESIQYARIRAELESRGEVIGPNDLVIASTVIAHEGVLVTNNEREFDRVTGLTVENWITS